MAVKTAQDSAAWQDIWVYIEGNGPGDLRGVSLELLGVGRALADAGGCCLLGWNAGMGTISFFLRCRSGLLCDSSRFAAVYYRWACKRSEQLGGRI